MYIVATLAVIYVAFMLGSVLVFWWVLFTEVINMNKIHPNAGSTLEDFLNEDGILEQATNIAENRMKMFKMTMIEKVARALAAKQETENEFRFYMDSARAAIEAMREPTEEMLKSFYGDAPIEQWLGNDWRDMIDAALKE